MLQICHHTSRAFNSPTKLLIFTIILKLNVSFTMENVHSSIRNAVKSCPTYQSKISSVVVEMSTLFSIGISFGMEFINLS